jgi:hypothetical protein
MENEISLFFAKLDTGKSIPEKSEIPPNFFEKSTRDSLVAALPPTDRDQLSDL